MTEPKQLTDWLGRFEIQKHVIDFDLTRLRRVWRRMRTAPLPFAIVTVGGTNGKGSTTAFLESIYCAAGYRVGVTRSPHLLKFNERIRVDKRDADDVVIADAFARIEHAAQAIPLTYFEYAILAAVHIFCACDVDIAVLEVGLGGRLDAVNIFDADTTIVTSIAIDHTRFLGNTRASIAGEKAGIARKDVPMIIGERAMPETFFAHCSAIGAPVLQIDRDFSYTVRTNDWRLQSPDNTLDLPLPILAGAHQYDNAACAVIAADHIARRCGLAISHDAYCVGVGQAKLFGRFQRIACMGKTMIVDVAHNVHAATALVQTAVRYGMTRFDVIVRTLQDKNTADFVTVLAPYVAWWHIPEASYARDESTDILITHIRACSTAGSTRYADAAAACRGALARTDEIATIIACGSFVLTQEVLSYCAEYIDD